MTSLYDLGRRLNYFRGLEVRVGDVETIGGEQLGRVGKSKETKEMPPK